ncbi:hypothetical protein Lal_00037344 [Lupinus albus]|nr:hypothetical protein Lal_00037344 [Lupinus albus]
MRVNLERSERSFKSKKACESFRSLRRVNKTTHVMSRVLIRYIIKKTPYELYIGRKPNIAY